MVFWYQLFKRIFKYLPLAEIKLPILNLILKIERFITGCPTARFKVLIWWLLQTEDNLAVVELIQLNGKVSVPLRTNFSDSSADPNFEIDTPFIVLKWLPSEISEKSKEEFDSEEDAPVELYLCNDSTIAVECYAKCVSSLESGDKDRCLMKVAEVDQRLREKILNPKFPGSPKLKKVSVESCWFEKFICKFVVGALFSVKRPTIVVTFFEITYLTSNWSNSDIVAFLPFYICYNLYAPLGRTKGLRSHESRIRTPVKAIYFLYRKLPYKKLPIFEKKNWTFKKG